MLAGILRVHSPFLPPGAAAPLSLPRMVRQPEAKGFSLRISWPDKMLGAVSPGDLKALLCELPEGQVKSCDLAAGICLSSARSPKGRERGEAG